MVHYDYTNRFDVHFLSFTRHVSLFAICAYCCIYCKYFLDSDTRQTTGNVHLKTGMLLDAVAIRC